MQKPNRTLLDRDMFKKLLQYFKNNPKEFEKALELFEQNLDEYKLTKD